jgi:endonuclease YncB( thermonuclease family)
LVIVKFFGGKPVGLCSLVFGAGKKAKAFLSILQPKKSYRAICEFVYSGSRVKVRVPSESAIFQFSMAQIRCPLTARAGTAGREGEPFAEEAKAFTRRHLLQRDIEIVIDSVDKNGIAMGRVYSITFNPNNPNKYKRGSPYAPVLLQQGLAKLDRYAEDGDAEGDSLQQLQASQDLAKLGKLGLWSLPENVETTVEDSEGDLESTNIDSNEATGGKNNSPWVVGNTVNVKLSEIVDVASCFVNVRNESGGIDQLCLITDAITELVPILSAAYGENAGNSVSRGQLVAVKFEEKSRTGAESSSDAAVSSYWCRGVVNSIHKGNAEVFYIDYGDR